MVQKLRCYKKFCTDISKKNKNGVPTQSISKISKVFRELFGMWMMQENLFIGMGFYLI